MQIISKKKAKLQKLRHYYTGIPCNKGHLCKRYVNCGVCFECAKIRAREVKRTRNKTIPENFRFELSKQEKLDKKKEKNRQYVIKNIDKIKEIKRKSAIKNRIKRNAIESKRLREKRASDPIFRLNRNISKEIWAFLNGKKQGKTWKSFIDYDHNDLIKHLESKFDDKMTWDNYGSYWELDHIKPLKYFEDEENSIRLAWSLDNLQPLEKSLNRSKGCRFIGDRLEVLRRDCENKRKPIQKSIDKHNNIIELGLKILSYGIPLNYIQLSDIVDNNKNIDYNNISSDLINILKLEKERNILEGV